MYFSPRRYPYRQLDSADHEVVVAGAGPVGLAAALGLGRRGVRVTVLEAGDSVSFGSRAICLSRHSLEVLDRLGVGAAISAQALPWTTGRSFFRDVEVLEFQMPCADGDPHPPMVNISQSAAEQVLVDAAGQAPGCTIAWQHTVTGVAERGDQVLVTVSTPEGPRELRADWLVAADGARSTVRDALGLRLRGTSYTGTYLIADIRWKAGLPTERRVWFDPPVSPGQTVILHRQPDDIWRFDCQLPPGADPAAELAPERVRARIAMHLDWIGNTEPWTLEWSSVYSARALSLDNYVHGRVVFAGDAAHLVPIFGVRGLNSGLEDAETLAWMLAPVVAGTAPAGLLAAYAHERHEAWRQNIAQADLSTLFMTPGTDGYRQTRDAVLALAPRRPELRQLINPRQSSATHARTSPLTISRPSPLPSPAGSSPLPGDPVPDALITVGARRAGLHAARGPDFTLLGFGAADDDRAMDALSRVAAVLRSRLGPPVGVQVLATTTDDSSTSAAAEATPAGVTVASDRDGGLTAALGAVPGEVYLIRPDGLLAARYPEAAALGDPELLARHILHGGATRPAVPAAAAAAAAPADRDQPHPAALSVAEQVWRSVSDALDGQPPGAAEPFLTRLVLLLALDLKRPDVVASRVAEALAAG